MAASAGVDYPGALVTTQLMATTNINVNRNCPFMDISPYTGVLELVINAGNSSAGQLQPIVVLGTSNNDFNRSNQVNYTFVTNFDCTLGGQTTVNIDTRALNAANLSKLGTAGSAAAANSTNNTIYKYMCLEWYIGGGVPNVAMDATVIGQKKYSS